MATTVGERCTLVRAFVEFELLPDLLARVPVGPSSRTPTDDSLGFRMPGRIDVAAVIENWTDFLEETGANIDHVEPEDLPENVAMERYLAEDAWKLVKRLGWVSRSGPTSAGQSVAYIAERSMMRRTRADLMHLMDTIAGSVRENYVGADEIEVVPLVQEGARLLAETAHVWASYLPGLLLVEFEALIHWAFARPRYAASLRDDLVTYRDVAMHRYDAPSPDADPDDNLLLHAEAVSRLYLETEGLAARTDLTITEVRSTAMLLTFAGLLDEVPLSLVSYLTPPDATRRDG